VAEDAVWIDVRTFLSGDEERTAERLEALLADGG
jgi:hypothetical protein